MILWPWEGDEKSDEDLVTLASSLMDTETVQGEKISIVLSALKVSLEPSIYCMFAQGLPFRGS